MIKSTKKPCYLADSSQMQFQKKKCNKATKTGYSFTKQQKINLIKSSLSLQTLSGPWSETKGGEKGDNSENHFMPKL